MKQKFLAFSLNLIHKYHPNYDSVKMDELRYGLEGFYLTITKILIIFILSIFFHLFSEMIMMMVIFNLLRTSGFGLHASKSWVCLVSSSIVFLLLPYISKIIVIPLYLKIMLGILAIILCMKYAPADTKKRPLINQVKRRKYKVITSINCTILVILSIIIKNDVISNLIIFGIYNEIVMILPITYKIFHLSYNNYKNYKPILKQG